MASAHKPSIVDLDDLYLDIDSELEPPTLANATASTPTTWRQHCRPMIGVALALTSAFTYSLLGVAVKLLLERQYEPWQLGVVRLAVLVLPTIVLLVVRPRFSHANNPLALAVLRRSGVLLSTRALLGTLVLLLRFYSLQKLPLGDAATIQFSSPVWVALISRVVLQERMGRATAVCIGVSLVGSVMLAQPEFQTRHWAGFAAAFASAILSAAVYVAVRALRDEAPHVIMFYFGLIGALVCTAITFATGERKMLVRLVDRDVSAMALMAAASLAGQFLITNALKIERATTVSLARTSDVLWSFAWEILLFRERPTVMTLCGAALVLGGSIGILIERAARAQAERLERRRVEGELQRLVGFWRRISTAIAPQRASYGATGHRQHHLVDDNEF